MSFLFSHWKDDETNEEKYNKIIGSDFSGRDESELRKDIEKSLENNFTSRIERKELLNLLEKINYDNTK